MKRLLSQSIYPPLTFFPLAVTLIVGGCRPAEIELPEKASRPVSVLELQKRIPDGDYMVSGAVKAWKTEQIGFEVAGRIEWVLEPGEDVERRDGELDSDEFRGTPMAKIDSARYSIALASAKAQQKVADLKKESIRIRLKDSLPASKKSAEANFNLAIAERDRIQTLSNQGAASLSELEKAENDLQAAIARLETVNASLLQTEADLAGAEAESTNAAETVKDAQRDFDNTTLYASYHGQISDVHVVPGSVVAPGAPVVTLQMMDPIKIEVELSSEKSRQFRRRHQVPVSFDHPDGSRSRENAFVYNVATSADASTRTFSLTLLKMNKPFHPPLPRGADENTKRAADIWPLDLRSVIGAPDGIFVEEGTINQDDQGSYIYQVTNANLLDTLPELLEVERKPVTVQKREIPFLGIWNFVEVSFDNGSEGDSLSLIIGELDLDGESAADWQGNTVTIDSGTQRPLRPGDLVEVNLSEDKIEEGFYVPINAIYEESGTTSLFVVEGRDTARKLEVETVMPSDAVDRLLRSPDMAPMKTDLEMSLGDYLKNSVASQTPQSGVSDSGFLVEVRSDDLYSGLQVIVGGVHYLRDGDRVRLPDANFMTDGTAE